MKFRSEDEDCPSCGMTHTERAEWIKRNIPSGELDQVSTELIECQFCGAMKCVACDMGQDVACNSCPHPDDY